MAEKKGKRAKKKSDFSPDSNRAISEHLLEIAALYDLSRSFNATIDLKEIIENSETLLKSTLGVDDFSILLLDETGSDLRLVKATGPGNCPPDGFCMKVGEGIIGQVAKRGKSILVEDVLKEDRLIQYKGGQGSLLSIPLFNNAAKVIGVFNIHRKETGSFKRNEVLLFEAAAAQMGVAIERARLFQQVESQAIIDDLTGLYSRRYFLATMEKTISNTHRISHSFGLLMMDVDHFKEINDRFGHPEGDRVLAELGALINAHVRKGDVACRFGGEELILLLPDVGMEELLVAGEKLRSLIEESIFCGSGKKRRCVTVSIGAAAYPNCGETVPSILSTADKALYLAKRSGRNQVRSFSEADKPFANDRRKSRRYKVALRRAYVETDGVKAIDLQIGDRWVPCVVENISDHGFKATVCFELTPGEVHSVKVRTLGKGGREEELNFLCRNLGKTTPNQFAVGMEIVDDPTNWHTYLSKIVL